MPIGDVREPRLRSYHPAQGLRMDSPGSIITLVGNLRGEF